MWLARSLDSRMTEHLHLCGACSFARLLKQPLCVPQAPGPLCLPVQLHHGEQAKKHICSSKALKSTAGSKHFMMAAVLSWKDETTYYLQSVVTCGTVKT